MNRAKENRSKLVYADVSLLATPASIRVKDVYVNSYKVGALSADNPDNPSDYTPAQIPADYDMPVDYVTRNSTIPEDNNKKMYLFNDAIPSAQNIAYNAEVRKRAHFKLEKNINVNAVKQAIHNIFSWTPGERILNPEFGTKLRQFLYEGITTYNKEQIMAEIQRCISEWEPRARIEHVYDISKTIDTEYNTVKIEIVYSIPGLTDEQFSYTYEVQATQ